MKYIVKFIVIIAVMSIWNSKGYAFDAFTHKGLTGTAVELSSQSVVRQIFNDSLGVDADNHPLNLDQSTVSDNPHIPSDQLENRLAELTSTNNPFLTWVLVGSSLEDSPMVRAKHHFHDPYRNLGLDDANEHPDWAWWMNLFMRGTFEIKGASALKRALGTEEQEWENQNKNYFN